MHISCKLVHTQWYLTLILPQIRKTNDWNKTLLCGCCGVVDWMRIAIEQIQFCQSTWIAHKTIQIKYERACVRGYVGGWSYHPNSSCTFVISGLWLWLFHTYLLLCTVWVCQHIYKPTLPISRYLVYDDKSCRRQNNFVSCIGFGIVDSFNYIR